MRIERLARVSSGITFALLALLLLVGLSGTVVADRPIEVPISFSFPDTNPCTGNSVLVTVTGTSSIHFHNGRVIIHNQKTVTTSDGFAGRGTDTIVDIGNIFKFTLNDMLTDGSGDRLRAHIVFVFNGQTGSVQVEKGGIPVCLGP